MGAKFVTFPKFQTSASQTETLFPLSSPPPSVSPFILRGRQNALSTSRETPASSILHPIAPNPPPPNSITPEPVPRCRCPTQPQPQHPQGLSSWSQGRAASTTPMPTCVVPEPLR